MYVISAINIANNNFGRSNEKNSNTSRDSFLGCSLTACTPSDDTDTGETKEPSSEPSEENQVENQVKNQVENQVMSL